MVQGLAEGGFKGAVVELALVKDLGPRAQHIVKVPRTESRVGQDVEVLGVHHANVFQLIGIPNSPAFRSPRRLGEAVFSDDQPGFNVLVFITLEYLVRPTGEPSTAASPIRIDEEIGRFVGA